MSDTQNDRRRRTPAIVMGVSVLVGCALYLLSLWIEDRMAAPATLANSSSFQRSAFNLAQKIDPLEGLERACYDWRALLASRFAPAPAEGLGFVVIDDESIRDIGRGESLQGLQFGLLWPRYLYAKVLEELRAQGARAVGFDIFFSDIRYDHAALAIGNTNIDSDSYFSTQLRRSKDTAVILAAVTNSVPAFLFRVGSTRLGDVSSLRDSDGIARRVWVYLDYEIPSYELEYHAFQQGMRLVQFYPQVVLGDYENHSLVTNSLEANGRLQVELGNGLARMIPTQEKPRVWSMGIQLAASVLGLDLSKAFIEDGKLHLPGTNGVSRVVPVNRHGQMYIDWTVSLTQKAIRRESFEEVLASGVLRDKGPLSEIQTNWMGKTVLIGSLATANNMADLGATPLRGADFLAGSHYNVANSIIQNRFVHEWPFWAELLLVVALGLLAGVANLRLTPERATLVAAICGAIYVAIAILAFLKARLWLPIAHPLVGGLGLTHAVMLTYRAFFEQRERLRVKAVFSKLVSPEVVHELLRLERFSLGGARRRITVFFADVRGFTEMTDRRQAAAEEYVKTHGLTGNEAEAYYEQEAKEVLDTVNRYLSAIAKVVKDHNGTLDKYIGDCVMAFWGSPTADPLHAVHAVQAAIESQRAIHELNLVRAQEHEARQVENEQRLKEGLPPLPPVEQLALGTGVNTGTMMVGLMGSEDHTLNYTAFGREVNLASRLEGVSGRSRIIIGEATYRELLEHSPELAALCVMRDSVQVKGFRGAVTNYEVQWKVEAEGNTVAVRRPFPRSGKR